MTQLTRYDPEKGCFVLKGKPRAKFWPGSKIIKSYDNAFDWSRGTERAHSISETERMNRLHNQKLDTTFKTNAVITYSRAKV